MNDLEISKSPVALGEEIRSLTNQAKAMTLYFAVEIGRRLTAAKSMLPHGEWGSWLEAETEFSQRKANRLMQLFDEYGADQIGLFGALVNSSTLSNLSISNALALLSVPESEREAFAQEVDAEHLSARELEKAIRDREKAELDAREAEEKAAELEDSLSAARDDAKQLEEKLRHANEVAINRVKEKADAEQIAKEAQKKAVDAELRAQKAEQKVRELESRPVEVAVQVDQNAINKAVDKAKRDAAKEREELEKQLEEARQAAQEAELANERVRQAEEKAEKLRKALAAADSDVAVFQSYFQSITETFNRAAGVIKKVEARDPELAGKLKNFVKDALGKMGANV